MRSLEKTLKYFNSYVVKGDATPFSQHMLDYNNKMADLKYDFHTLLINAHPEIKIQIQELLSNLKVPKKQWGRYLDKHLTTHDFLLELKQGSLKEKSKVVEFIEFIDAQAQNNWLKIVLAGLVVLLAGEIVWPWMSSFWVNAVLAAVFYIPVIGVIYNSFLALYCLYKNIVDPYISLFQRVKDSAFLIVNTALKVTAYGLLISPAFVASPVTAILFVAAEVVSVLKETVSLLYVIFQASGREKISDSADLETRQTYARYEFDFIKRRNSVLINMLAAVISVGIVAAWCFIPGGVIVPIVAIAAIGVVYLAKTMAYKKNEAIIRASRQRKFESIESEYGDSETPCQSEDTLTVINDGVLPPQDEAKPMLTRQPLARPSKRGFFAQAPVVSQDLELVTMGGPASAR